MRYPLRISHFALENGPAELVDLSILYMVIWVFNILRYIEMALYRFSSVSSHIFHGETVCFLIFDMVKQWMFHDFPIFSMVDLSTSPCFHRAAARLQRSHPLAVHLVAVQAGALRLGIENP